MKLTPKVTFLIPCYNASKYIVDALNCVVKQTYQNLEIILIDDGSTDNTLTLLQQFAQKDDRIVLIKNEQNLGLIRTLNKGVELATGDYIARFDADDIIGTDRIEKQIEIVNRNSTIELITSYVNYITPSGKFHSQAESFYCYTFNSIKFLNLFECPLVHAGMLIKSSILKNVKYNYKSEFMHIEDHELFTKLINQGVNIFVNRDKNQKYLYRRNLSSVSNRHKSVQVENAINMAKLNIKSFLNYEVDTKLLEPLVLKNKIEWSTDLIKNSFDEFKRIKNTFINKENINLSALDKKLINNWYHLRSLKIISTILLQGNISCKLLSIYYFFLNAKFILNIKFWKNLISRFVYIFNSIRYHY
ncbi:MAG: glycosyltransferase family 2 protein [Bacteroidota bacterium]